MICTMLMEYKYNCECVRYVDELRKLGTNCGGRICGPFLGVGPAGDDAFGALWAMQQHHDEPLGQSLVIERQAAPIASVQE
jgi:hypothetical protein